MVNGKPQQIYMAIIEPLMGERQVLVTSFTTPELRQKFLQQFLENWWKEVNPFTKKPMPSYEQLSRRFHSFGYGMITRMDAPLIATEPDIDLLFEEKS